MHDSDQHMLSQMMDGEWEGLDPSRCAAMICDDPAARARWARYHIIRDVLNNEPVSGDMDLAARVRASIDNEPAYSNIAVLQGAGEAAAGAVEPLPAAVVATPGLSTAAFGAAVPAAVTGIRAQAARPAWFRGRASAGLAVAASMALVTVVGLNLLEPGVDGSPAEAGDQRVAEAATPATAIAEANLPVSESRPAFSPVTTLPGTVLPQVEYVANRGSHWVTGQQGRQAAAESRLNMFLSQHIENSPTADHQGMLPYSRLVGYDELPAK